MSQPTITLLGRALLGLLQDRPASGYDLRKIFTETPMGSFSDSPGAIYPALERLEAKKLVRGRVESGPGLRQRKIFHLTAAGLKELTTWLTAPVEEQDVVRRMNELMLRFAFLDRAVGEEATLRFLQSLEAELRNYVPKIKRFFKDHAVAMPTSGRLALEAGVLGYEARLRWTVHAISVYRKEFRK
jgi:DNA-binding PadR family transcriptional regulator